MTWGPVTGGRQHCTPATLPKTFVTRKPVVCFLHVDKTGIDVFILARFIETLLANENYIPVAASSTKTALGFTLLQFNCFAESFFKVLGIYFYSEAKERDVPLVSAFTAVALFVHEDNHSVFPICRRPPRPQATWNRWVSQRPLSLFKALNQGSQTRGQHVAHESLLCGPWRFLNILK